MGEIQQIRSQLAELSLAPPSYWRFDIVADLLGEIVKNLPEKTRVLELVAFQEPGSVLTPFLVRQFQLSGIRTIEDLLSKRQTLNKIPSLGVKKTLVLCELIVERFGGVLCSGDSSVADTDSSREPASVHSSGIGFEGASTPNHKPLAERLPAIREELRCIEYGAPRPASKVVDNLFGEIVAFLPTEMKAHSPEKIPWSIPWACSSQNWRLHGINTIGDLAEAGSRLVDAQGVGKKKIVAMMRDLLSLLDIRSTRIIERELKPDTGVKPNGNRPASDDHTLEQRILSVMPSPPYRHYELDIDIWNNRLRWAADSERAVKLAEIAERHCVTREFVRQRELRLIGRLTKCREIGQLQTYLRHRLISSELPVYVNFIASSDETPVPDLHNRWPFYGQILNSLSGPFLFPEHQMDSLIAVSSNSYEHECEALYKAIAQLELWISGGNLLTRAQMGDEVRLACQAAGFAGGRLYIAVDLVSGLLLYVQPSAVADEVVFGVARYEDGRVKRPYLKQELWTTMQKAVGRKLTSNEFYSLSGKALSRLGLEPWSESFVAISSSRDLGSEFSALDRERLRVIADEALALMTRVSRVGWTYESLLKELQVDEDSPTSQKVKTEDLRSALRLFASEEIWWAKGKRFCLAARRAQMVTFRDEVRQLLEQAGGPMHLDDIKQSVIDRGINDWIQIIPKLPVVRLEGRRYGIFPRDLQLDPHEIPSVREFVKRVVDHLRQNGGNVSLSTLLARPHTYGIERIPDCLAIKLPSEVHEVIQALSSGIVRIGDTITFESNSRNGGSWQERYDALLFYVTEQGCFPPSMENGSPNPLYRWLAVQKMKLRAGELSEEQCALLKDIGVLESRAAVRDNWTVRYDSLVSYLLQSGGGWPPSRINGKIHPLYQWMAIQRRRRREDSLSEEQIAMLNKIRFQW